MTQYEAGGIVALAAKTQQILVQAQRQIQFAAKPVMNRLSPGDMKVLRGRIQPLPQLSCTSMGMARFRRRKAFNDIQHCA